MLFLFIGFIGYCFGVFVCFVDILYLSFMNFKYEEGLGVMIFMLGL